MDLGLIPCHSQVIWVWCPFPASTWSNRLNPFLKYFASDNTIDTFCKYFRPDLVVRPNNFWVGVSKKTGKPIKPRKPEKKQPKKPNRKKKPIKPIKFFKKPAGSVRFYNQKTKKTEPNRNRQTTRKKPSQNRVKPEKPSQNRKNRFEPVFSLKKRTETGRFDPVSVFFSKKKIRFDYFFW